jgi:hypothetical protein
MANEFRITQSLTYENGKLKDTYQPAQFQLPQASQGLYSEVISVTTTTQTIDFAELTTPGRIIMQSLEATTTGNSVSWGPTTSTGGTLVCGVIKARDSVMMFMNSTSTIRIYSAATVNVLVKAYEA